jgi:hypothetical protein
MTHGFNAYRIIFSQIVSDGRSRSRYMPPGQTLPSWDESFVRVDDATLSPNGNFAYVHSDPVNVNVYDRQ